MLWTKCFRAKKVVALTGNYAPPEVTIRSYPDSPICDVVVVVRGHEMVLRCRDHRQAMRWARLERKSYKIADSDDLARVYRFDLAQDSEMISPTIPI
jgi:hypothetical protein